MTGSVRQKEVERVCKAMQRANLPIRRVIVSEGQFQVIVGVEDCDSDRLVDDPEAAEKAEDRRKLEAHLNAKQRKDPETR